MESVEDAPRKNSPREVVDDCMHIDTAAVEESEDRGIDVPDLIRFGPSYANFRFCGMNTRAWSTPTMESHEAIPRGGRGEDPADSLCQSGQSSGGHMPEIFRRDHLVNEVDFRGRQLLR